MTSPSTGAGVTPTLEYMAEQLAHALPERTQCGVENVTRPFEGGTVRTLAFRCGRAVV